MNPPERSLTLYTDQRLISENRWLKLGLIVYGGVIALSGAAAYEASSIIPHASLVIEIPAVGLALATLPNLVGATRDFLTNNGERYLRRSIASGEVMRSLSRPAGPPQISQGAPRPRFSSEELRRIALYALGRMRK